MGEKHNEMLKTGRNLLYNNERYCAESGNRRSQCAVLVRAGDVVVGRSGGQRTAKETLWGKLAAARQNTMTDELAPLRTRSAN